MTMKAKVLVVRVVGGQLATKGEDYLVIKCRNSTEYKPGSFLSEEQVNDVIRRPHWNVDICGNSS